MRRFFLLMTYVIEFAACAFIGWLYEEALELIVNHAYGDRGLLHVPLIPIYGFGGMILLLCYRKKEHSALFVFLTSAVITTVLELAASYPLQKILGFIPWYYEGWPLNYEGRISLLSSLIFGGLSVLLVKVIHPLCRKLEKAPAAPVYIAGLIFSGIFLIDGAVVLIGPLLKG